MGLAKEVAYNALLAFFPAVAFLLGLLGLLHPFDQVQSFLGTVAPHGGPAFLRERARTRTRQSPEFVERPAQACVQLQPEG